MRDVAVNVQAELGDQYAYRLDKAQALDQAAQAFLVMQALITTYGLMSLAVVGLLVYTLVMTNVQEQRREMAILRILGSQRQLLFRHRRGRSACRRPGWGRPGRPVGTAITTFVVVPLIWQY